MDDLTGKQFGPYEIGEPLGEGGMAAVYKAYHPSMNRHVAIKVLPRQMAKSPEFVIRFRREAELLAQLQHPHILPVFDSGQADGYAYIVMPLMQTGSLADLMESRRLSLPEIRRIMAQVGDALGYAHARGMIHRDVKPSNVLLDERGNCLLTDFGLARMSDASAKLTSSGAIMGTPAYMSPEQGTSPNVDGRSDIYSLGVVLYEMVSGRIPFSADTPIAIVFKHMLDPLPSIRELVPDIPVPLERVINKSLAKKPDERYQHAEDFVKAVQQAIQVTAMGEHMAPTSQPTVEAMPPVRRPDPPQPATMVSMPAIRRPDRPQATMVSMPPQPRPKPPSQPPAARPASITQAPAQRRSFLPWLFAGVGILGICFIGLIVLAIVWNYFQDKSLLITFPTSTPDVVTIDTATPEPGVTEEHVVEATSTPEIVVVLVATPTLPDPPTLVIPPDTNFSRINAITINDQNQYVVEYETFKYTESSSGMHVHFFFNTVPQDMAGMPGGGPWKVYGGPRPFKGYRTTDRPPNASQLCILVANSNHSIAADSGNCFALPDVATVTARVDTACVKAPNESGEMVVTFKAGAISLLRGFSSDKAWYYIQNPVTLGTNVCWVPIESSITGGDTSTLPTVDS